MVPALLLVHAVLALPVLVSRWLPREARRWVVVECAALGVIAAGALAVVADGGETWRSVRLGPEVAAVAVAIGCAWLIAGVVGLTEATWEQAAAVGVGSSGLGLAVANEWAVPALLFWLCSSLAVVALARGSDDRAWVWPAHFLGDALLVAGIFGWALENDVWGLPSGLDGWPLYVVLGGLALRAGSIPLGGPWTLLRTSPAVVPLVVAGSLAMLARLTSAPLPWAAVGALILAAGPALLVIVGRRVALPAIGSWAVLVSLGAVVGAPAAAPAAAVQAALVATALVLWPRGSLATPEGALLVALSPVGPGFWSLVAVASVAQAKAGESATALGSLSWRTLIAVVPLVLAAGIGLAARAAKAGNAQDGRPEASWSLRAVVAVSAVLVLFGAGLFDYAPGITEEPSGPVVLVGAALVVGAVAAWLTTRGRGAPDHMSRGGLELVDPPRLGRIGPILRWGALGVIAAACGAVAWLAFEGLRTGFL